MDLCQERVEQCASFFDAGNLMEAARLLELSHASCRDLYHISTPGLEKLVCAAKACGAIAARITGAGFGGSIVALVPNKVASGFRDRLWDYHFAALSPNDGQALSREEVILECRPSQGAFARKLH